TSFTSGATVVKGEEIEDLCIEMEHSNVQDLAMYLICPTGKTVTLKYPTNNPFQTFLGQPAGTITSGYLTYDTEDNQPINDSNANKMGYTWTYCFSNTYLTNPQGVLHGVIPNVIKNFTYGESETGSTWFTNDVVDSTHYWVDKIMFFQTPTQGILGSTTYDATNPSAAYFDALTPDLTGFDQFIGCPLNGTWTLRICDNLEDNNGWITSWWMDVSKTAATEWTYEVPIDTVLWGGPFIDAKTSTAQTAVISPKIAECGEYSYNVQVVDYFGCKWPVKNDLKLDLNVVCTPVVSLGDDIHICEGTSVPLDAGNKGATAFAWEPTGDKTQKITVKSAENVIGRKSYAVQVTNFNGNLYCYGGDTIDIITHPAATASFTSDVMPLEGCEPYTFRLISTSSEAAKYEWSLGDGLYNTTEASPTFTFPYGTYDLKLKVTSDFGCVDSVYYDNMINVFKSPAANFGWEPTVPYASSPTVNMINLTVPEDENNRYRWWIQTNKHNENDIVNEYGKTPTFTWVAQEGENVAGDYNITLDAYSCNVAPSGNIYECHDTITKTITIINDNIIFPTVVTPNADGINDVFDIHNLIEGQAFPDNELAVYNRLGKRIYFVQDIRNKDQFWDPDKTNSPTGTYFYRFIGRGPVRNVEFKGSVEVIRD
ncbi:MAG: gliding motility-associated C-terminal domain-containing protein, partial [Bacteroidales bacterium]|nr:gliding motility-associated C-terminal domain-containing protein [Bacteroidales bacterium]